MCTQNYITYKTCTHTNPSHKTPCPEAGLPTQYRQNCKLAPRISPEDGARTGTGTRITVESMLWSNSKYRIPEDRREEKDGICPDCAGALRGEMGRVFRRREEEAVREGVIEMEKREKERQREMEKEKEKEKGGGWRAFFG
ncbi:uncharacterized protein N7496_005808 [Penicillium cataractarum]|uniref:Uncharacterized protein n=1 Tax=Penicillium cataractarum TaxID=2100454 RepID=A0A9W9V811_9EURO|nr:uncharacterized protein N7496_005808 [Penicillium cataractarum]KAJ5369716.1 hypothetical protein N7496_005808 [Penicillium cataractarum]